MVKLCLFYRHELRRLDHTHSVHSVQEASVWAKVNLTMVLDAVEPVLNRLKLQVNELSQRIQQNVNAATVFNATTTASSTSAGENRNAFQDTRSVSSATVMSDKDSYNGLRNAEDGTENSQYVNTNPLNSVEVAANVEQSSVTARDYYGDGTDDDVSTSAGYAVQQDSSPFVASIDIQALSQRKQEALEPTTNPRAQSFSGSNDQEVGTRNLGMIASDVSGWEAIYVAASKGMDEMEARAWEAMSAPRDLWTGAAAAYDTRLAQQRAQFAENVAASNGFKQGGDNEDTTKGEDRTQGNHSESCSPNVPITPVSSNPVETPRVSSASLASVINDAVGVQKERSILDTSAGPWR